MRTDCRVGIGSSIFVMLMSHLIYISGHCRRPSRQESSEQGSETPEAPQLVQLLRDGRHPHPRGGGVQQISQEGHRHREGEREERHEGGPGGQREGQAGGARGVRERPERDQRRGRGLREDRVRGAEARGAARVQNKNRRELYRVFPKGTKDEQRGN